MSVKRVPTALQKALSKILLVKIYTIVWEIFECNNFRMGKFLYNNGCLKFERAKRDFRLNILGTFY